MVAYIAQQLDCSVYIPSLGVFVASAKQYNQKTPTLSVVVPVSWPLIYA